MIIAPRHVADGDSTEKLARDAFKPVARRSKGDAISPDTPVYIADTIGEMGLWYRLAPVSFVGHSLQQGLEGKNPFEAAALGSAILHGPHMSYFSESYAALTSEGGAHQARNANELAEAVLQLQDLDRRHRMTDGAARVIASQRAVLTDTWKVLNAHLRSSD